MGPGEVEYTVDIILKMYAERGGEEYAGENVSQLEHMCQAAKFAVEEGYDDEVVLAAFLHDLGHLLPKKHDKESMGAYGMMDHEKIGAEYLRKLGFSERLCGLIASHVNAKRYLTWKDPAYFNQLSPASRETLEYQGGKMQETEARLFEVDPLFDLYIKMRRWDEAAKLNGQPLPDLNPFRSRAIAHLENQYAAKSSRTDR